MAALLSDLLFKWGLNMILELLFNGMILAVSILCFVNITLVAPEPTPGNMNAAQWPQLIFGLLVLCLIINMLRIWKAAPPGQRNLDSLKNIRISGFVKSRLFWGIGFMFLYVLLLQYMGFIPGSLLFGGLYMILLGEKKPLRILLADLILVAVIYCLFINLEVMLPRGVSVFRTFHLWAEGLVRI